MGSRCGAGWIGRPSMRAPLMPPDSPLLRVSKVAMRFGGVVALGGVSFDVGYGQICGLIGPNGSGKTTLFNCISGFYRFADGDILFEGRSLKNLGRHRMAGLGIGRTFQNVALFRRMSVRDNILVGAHHLGRSGFIANALRLPVVRQEDAVAVARLHDLLDLLDLQRRRRHRGRQPAVRHAEARRAGARADRRPEAAAAGRAGRRAEPQRGRRPGTVAAAHPRAFRPQHPAGRASHEPGDARVATRWWRWSSA